MIDSVLLVAFGGPTSRAEIRPFLQNVARGRRIPAERLELVATHYEHMPGGRSPFNERTFEQARALERALDARGAALPVSVGMRNWHPYLADTLTDMAREGRRRALGIILSPFRTEASWDRYMKDVDTARSGLSHAPDVVFAPPWSTRPGFIAAVTDRASAARAEIPEATRRWAPMLFTAHSVPVAMAAESPYVLELTAAVQAVVRALDHPRFTIAYQSRSGRPEDAWLEPDINDVLRSLVNDRERDVVIVPIGFVVDHVEVLYDLDVQARETAAACGFTVDRAACVNDHPAFIGALADLVVEAMKEGG